MRSLESSSLERAIHNRTPGFQAISMGGEYFFIRHRDSHWRIPVRYQCGVLDANDETGVQVPT